MNKTGITDAPSSGRKLIVASGSGPGYAALDVNRYPACNFPARIIYNTMTIQTRNDEA